MQRFWGPVALRAAAIFAAGMLVVTFVRHVTREAHAVAPQHAAERAARQAHEEALRAQANAVRAQGRALAAEARALEGVARRAPAASRERVHLDVTGDAGERVRLVSSDSGAALVVHDPSDGTHVRIVAGPAGLQVSVDSATR